MKAVWFIFALLLTQQAFALDIRRIPLCEDTTEPRIPRALQGTYQKLRSTYLITQDGVEQVPDINVGAHRTRIPEDQLERDYCKHTTVRAESGVYHVDVDITRLQNTVTGWNRHTLSYRLEYNPRTLTARAAHQSHRFGIWMFVVPGGRGPSFTYLPYRKL